VIRNQIEAIVKTLTAPPGFNQPGFLYGTANELNLLVDNASFPVVMLYTLKPIDKSTTLSNAVSDKFSIYMEFLFKTEFDQYTSDNETYIDMANQMCNEFLVKMENYRETQYASRYFKIHEGEGRKALPVYNKFQANSTGISLALTVGTMNNQNIPLP
jgi:hypothetical protein